MECYKPLSIKINRFIDYLRKYYDVSDEESRLGWLGHFINMYADADESD